MEGVGVKDFVTLGHKKMALVDNIEGVGKNIQIFVTSFRNCHQIVTVTTQKLYNTITFVVFLCNSSFMHLSESILKFRNFTSSSSVPWKRAKL